MMKNIYFLLLIITFFSGCKCKKNTIETNQEQTSTSLNECFENAVCTQEILKDSALDIQIDGTGKPFYTIVSKLGTTVYQYKMTENKDPQYQDGGYQEEIIFELPSEVENSSFSSKDLPKTKALFGVFCYCKGKAGYYFIKNGAIKKEKNTITVEIESIVEGQKVFKYRFQ